jgi:hypothetical protein
MRPTLRPCPVASPSSPHATTRTVCPRDMRVAANRIADIVVPLLLTLNVSLTSVMIITAPPLPGSFRSGPPRVADLVYFLPTDGSWLEAADHGGGVGSGPANRRTEESGSGARPAGSRS